MFSSLTSPPPGRSKAHPIPFFCFCVPWRWWGCLLVVFLTAAWGEAQTQSVVFSPPPPSNLTYGAAPIPLYGTSTSGLPVTFKVDSGPATVVNAGVQSSKVNGKIRSTAERGFFLAPSSESAAASVKAINSQYSSIDEFGDSITQGIGCTVIANCYGPLLLSDFGNSGYNFGVSGAIASDQAVVMYSNYNPQTSNNPAVSLMIGTNDIGAYGGAVGIYQADITGLLTWATIPRTAKIFITDPQCTSTGAWAIANIYGFPGGVETNSTPGDTYTCAVNSEGPALYIGFYQDVAWTKGSMSVSIDGGSAVALFSDSYYAHFYTYKPQVVRIPAAPGTHTVVFTNTSSVGGVEGMVAPAWIGSAYPMSTVSPPRIFVGDVPPQENNANSAIISSYNAALQAEESTLIADGLPIERVDETGGGPTGSGWLKVYNAITNPQDSDFQAAVLPGGVVCPASTSPGYHPNDCGHNHLREAFEYYIAADSQLPSQYLSITGAGSVVVEADASGNTYYSAAAPLKQTITVAQASSSLALTASTYQAAQGVSLTFTAMASSPAGVPTGTVTFLADDEPLGTVVLNAQGVAALAANTLPTGRHTIAASYSGDSNFSGSGMQLATPVIVSAPTFKLNLSTSAITLTQGNAGTLNVTAVPQGDYSGSVTLSCTGLPSDSECAFSPVSLTLDGSGTPKGAQLTITTHGPNAGAVSRQLSALPVPRIALALAGLFWFPGVLLARQRAAKRSVQSLTSSSWLPWILGFVLAGILTGCAGPSKSGITGGTITSPSTPPGGYTITVSATPAGGAAQIADLTLTVTQ